MSICHHGGLPIYTGLFTYQRLVPMLDFFAAQGLRPQEPPAPASSPAEPCQGSLRCVVADGFGTAQAVVDCARSRIIDGVV